MLGQGLTRAGPCGRNWTNFPHAGRTGAAQAAAGRRAGRGSPNAGQSVGPVGPRLALVREVAVGGLSSALLLWRSARECLG